MCQLFPWPTLENQCWIELTRLSAILTSTSHLNIYVVLPASRRFVLFSPGTSCTPVDLSEGSISLIIWCWWTHRSWEMEGFSERYTAICRSAVWNRFGDWLVCRLLAFRSHLPSYYDGLPAKTADCGPLLLNGAGRSVWALPSFVFLINHPLLHGHFLATSSPQNLQLRNRLLGNVAELYSIMIRL